MPITTNPKYPLTSEYYRPSSPESKDAPLLVFIPGNPGLIDYYVTFFDIIAEQYPKYAILAISHAGYQTSGDFLTAGNTGDQTYYDLDYQVTHKVKILKEQILSGHSNISILCHSVGGYITQRVVRALLKDQEVKDLVQFEFIGLICPTIVDIAKSLSGQFFGRLFSILPLVQTCVYLVMVLQFILPDALAKYIIRNFVIARPKLTDDKLMESWSNSLDATHKIYRSKRIVFQALTLAKDELKYIHRDDDYNDWFFHQLPEQYGTKVWSFFAHLDYWVHDNTRDYILSRYHDLENELVHFEVGDMDNGDVRAITHSFCIDQSVEFAEITCEALARK